MANNQLGPHRLRRNESPAGNNIKPSGPLRATIPFNLMTNTENRNTKIPSPNSSTYSRVNRQSPWRLRQGSPTQKGTNQSSCPPDSSTAIRRTASLDAIYLKGQWPKSDPVAQNLMLLHKSTQTPEEWYQHRGLEASPSRDRKQRQLLFQYQPSLTLPLVQLPQSSGGSISPNRVAVSTNTESAFSSPSPAIPVPPQIQSSRPARNSVEGFNTEIDKLVGDGRRETPSNKVFVFESAPDGHRAPIAELFKTTYRSVDTQTPVQASSNNSSSGNSSPCGSVSPSVWGLDLHQYSRPPSGCHIAEDIECEADDYESEYVVKYPHSEYDSLSPEDFQALSLGMSPQRRFLCREPPDGCEKIETLKVTESLKSIGPQFCPSINPQFVLQPSSSSAFRSLSGSSSMIHEPSAH